MPKGIDYDPEVIQSFANALYAQASKIIFTYFLIGFIVGGAIGFFLGAAASPGSEMMVALIGGVIVGLLGTSAARTKAFQLKLQAQQVLCQLSIEKNTRKG